MFTNKSFNASELLRTLGLNLVRDFEFAHCGKLGLSLPNMLVPIESEKYLRQLSAHSDVSGVVCTPDLVDVIEADLGIITAVRPREKVNEIQDFIAQLTDFQWESFDSKIDSSANVHPRAWVADKDVVIGKNVTIEAGAVIYPRTIIEEGVVVGPNNAIGYDAFESNPTESGLRRFAQSGGVILRRSATLLSNVCVTRAAYGGFTEIGERSMLDNLVHVAHDCIIGKDVKITACAELSGRVIVGDNSQIGMNATILNGITIGSNCDISLGAVVTKDVGSEQKVTGNFAIPHRDFLSNLRKNK